MLGLRPPKVVSEIAPHSPLATGFVRSQSGMKLRLASVQVRVTLVGEVQHRVDRSSDCLARTKRPRLTLIAVLPLPNRS